MTHYVALVHKEPESDYGVIFPDFPGCVSAGASFDEAMRMAAEALAGHVDLMRRDGDPIPAPRGLEEIKVAADDWLDWEGAIVTLVPLLPPPGRSIRINITIEERLLAQIDAATTNRSGFLAEAARRALSG